jgi:hypothetical protein
VAAGVIGGSVVQHAEADQQSAEVQFVKQRTIAGKLRRELHRTRKTYKRLRRDYRTLGLYVSPRESAWLCIHRHEGAWNANTGNGYFGGLQMDRSFMATYGPEFLSRWGTADRWPFWAQLRAADRAFAGRGFGPWPNTRRMCGL